MEAVPVGDGAGTGAAWWQSVDALARFLSDLIGAEASRLRPGMPSLPVAAAWTPDVRLDESGFGFDSLERLQLAAAVSGALHLHESGLDDYLLARPRFGDWCAVAAESLRVFSGEITFHSSGSTGAPKPCSHRLAALEREADLFAALFAAGGRTRVLTAVAAHHIYGFIHTVLLPARLGGLSVVDLRPHSPGSLPAMARSGDVIVGHPAFWAAVARAVPSGWPRDVTGITSTAPCPAETAAALGAAGLSRLLQIHGSSETAGLGWRDDPDDPYVLLPHWQRDSEERLSQIALPDAPAAPSRPVAAPDRLEWLDSRRYRVLGRYDGAVQVGGINVYPDRVREVLREHPGVADIAVRLMNQTEGVRLKAYVVPRYPESGLALLQAELEALAEARLSIPERPRAYTFGSVLPTSAMGKPADWPVALA